MAQEQITLTKDALQELLAKNAEVTAAALGDKFLEGIKELKKPTAEEQEKIDAERKRRKEAREAAVRDGLAQEIGRAQEQAACAHTKENGRHTFGGRVLNNGDASVSCSRCTKEYRWGASRDESANGGALFLQDPEHGFFRMNGAQIESYFTQREKLSPAKMQVRRRSLAELLEEKAAIEAKLGKAL